MDNALALNYTGAWRDPVCDGLPLGNGYRTYLPDLMRFNAPDALSPFGEGGINPYVYCSGDPINFADPSGQFQLSWQGGLGIFAALFGIGLAIFTEGSSLAIAGALFGVASAATGVAADNTEGKAHDVLTGLSMATGLAGGIADAADMAKSTFSALRLTGGIGSRTRVAGEAIEISPLLRDAGATGPGVGMGTSTRVEQWTLEELRGEGRWVGAGDFGSVYQVDRRAYKVSNHPFGESYWPATDEPVRIASLWNDFYSKAYGGRLTEFADARPLTLKSGEVVLDMPYMESTGIRPTATELDGAFQEVKRVSGRRVMDASVEGNILVHRATGLPVPVDFGTAMGLHPPYSPATERLRQTWQWEGRPARPRQPLPV